jgi:hypothetical protein
VLVPVNDVLLDVADEGAQPMPKSEAQAPLCATVSRRR